MLAKGLNFIISPQQLPGMDLITATESAIRKNKISEAEAGQQPSPVQKLLPLTSRHRKEGNDIPQHRPEHPHFASGQGMMHCGSQQSRLSQIAPPTRQ